MDSTRTDPKPSMFPRLFLGFVAVCLALALSAVWLRRELSAESYTQQTDAAVGGAPLWKSPAFSLVDHRGHALTQESLHGTPYVVDFIFTQCTTFCPLLTSKLVQLQQRTQGRALEFVSFSVDPAHDDAAVLREYANAWNRDEARWHLLATSWETLAPLVTGYRVTARQSSDRTNRVIHSNTFFLVDTNGMIRGVYDSSDPQELDRLTRDALAISRP